MSEEQLTEWVTKSEYARYRGVTPIYVSRWIERDKVPTKDGKLEVEVANRYWHKRPQSRQKKIDFDEARTKKNGSGCAAGGNERRYNGEPIGRNAKRRRNMGAVIRQNQNENDRAS